MSTKRKEEIEIQRRYYTETAETYESMHAHESCGDELAIKYVQVILRMLEASSVLDVGTATGRGLRILREALPKAFICGVEPVAALLDTARKNGVEESASLICGSGLGLPFADRSFDVVCEFGVLHHVREPNAMVREMLRVAKKAVLIFDSNRFGQGRLPVRLAKLAMYKTGVWPIFEWLHTRGKGYRVTEGDGLSYSYRVYDSYHLLAAWADRMILIPDGPGKSTTWLHPLLSSGGVLACAIKES